MTFMSSDLHDGRIPPEEIFPGRDPGYKVSFVSVPQSMSGVGKGGSGSLSGINEGGDPASLNRSGSSDEDSDFASRIRVIEGVKVSSSSSSMELKGEYVELDGEHAELKDEYADLKNDSPTGKTYLLLHGWAASSFSYADIIPELVNAGNRAIAIDLPGHGLSYKLDQASAESGYTAEYLVGIVEYVVNQLGLSRISLVGHSMGGALAAYFAIRNPSLIDELILIAPAGFERTSLMNVAAAATRPGSVATALPKLITRSVVKLMLKMAFGDKSRITERHIDQYWAPSRDPNYAYAVRGCLLNFNWEMAKHLDLAAITAPTKILYATKDNLVSEAAAKRYGNVIPNARMIRMEGVGHAITDEVPARVAAEVLDLMRK